MYQMKTRFKETQLCFPISNFKWHILKNVRKRTSRSLIPKTSGPKLFLEINNEYNGLFKVSGPLIRKSHDY